MSLSVIVAAAGTGSRMLSVGPKALSPVGDKLLLDIVLLNINKHVDEIILVVNENQVDEFEAWRAASADIPIHFVFQNDASGTAEAVKIGLSSARSEYSIVVWGDHIGASLFPIGDLLKFSRLHSADVIVPVVNKSKPYVYFGLNQKSQIVSFHETRFGAPEVDTGISDAGVFLIKRSLLVDLDKGPLGTSEKELNFLALFPILTERGLQVISFPLNNELLTLGANTPEELERSWRMIEPRIF